MKKAKASTSKAKHGEKMIEVNLKFWTNDIARKKDKIIPKHAWSSGCVCILNNESHGIKTRSYEYFHSMLGIGTAIEKALIKHGIVLHQTGKMKKYMAGGQR